MKNLTFLCLVLCYTTLSYGQSRAELLFEDAISKTELRSIKNNTLLFVKYEENPCPNCPNKKIRRSNLTEEEKYLAFYYDKIFMQLFKKLDKYDYAYEIISKKQLKSSEYRDLEKYPFAFQPDKAKVGIIYNGNSSSIKAVRDWALLNRKTGKSKVVYPVRNETGYNGRISTLVKLMNDLLENL